MLRKCCDQVRANSVYYNRFNGVVQCHNCGHVWTKTTKLEYLLNRIFKWW